MLKIYKFQKGVLEARLYHEGQIVNYYDNKHYFENIITNQIDIFKELVPEKQIYYLDVYSYGEIKSDPRFLSIISSLPFKE